MEGVRSPTETRSGTMSGISKLRVSRLRHCARMAVLLVLWANLPGVRGLAVEPLDVSASLERIREQHKVPALAAAAVHEGEVVAIGATGLRKRGDYIPVSSEDKW